MPGFECAFVEPVPKPLKCRLCMLPCRDTVLISSCGHKFCESCIDTYLRSGIFLCPEDKTSLDYAKIYPDPTTDGAVLSLHAKCRNCNKGCPWTGPLRSLKNHGESCPYDMTECPNRCSVKVLRKSASHHLLFSCQRRPLPCEHCGEMFPKESIEQHSNHCPHELIYCEGKCGEQMQRQFLLNHNLSECPKRLISCSHKCGKDVTFETLSEHYLSCSRLPVKCLHCTMLIPRADFSSHLKAHGSDIPEVTCPLRHAGCSYKSSQAKLEEHVRDNKDLHIKLLTRLVAKQKIHIALLTSTIHPDQTGQEGNLLWKISGFSRKMAKAKAATDGVGWELASPAFYNAKYAYRLQASIFLNGNGEGEGTHVSVYIKVVVGEYDALLEWPFQLPITFTLLDQSPDRDKRVHVKESFTPDSTCQAFHRPLKSSGRPLLGFGHARFVSHEVLRRRNYVREDTLFIQIVAGDDR